jgi:hypothetical protein
MFAVAAVMEYVGCQRKRGNVITVSLAHIRKRENIMRKFW